MDDSDDEADAAPPSVESSLAELRSAVVTLAKSNDEHDRRISALESEVESCRIGAQAAAKGIIELRNREQALSARFDALEGSMTNLRVEIGTKPSTTALEALLRLKMDRKACEQLFAELFQSRQALDDKVEGLDQEVQGLTFQLQGLHNSRAAAGTAISSRGAATSGATGHVSSSSSAAVAGSGGGGVATHRQLGMQRACGSAPPLDARGPAGGGGSGGGAPFSLRPSSAPRHTTPPAMPEPSDGSNYKREHFGVGTGGSALQPHAAQPHAAQPQATLQPAAPSGSDNQLNAGVTLVQGQPGQQQGGRRPGSASRGGGLACAHGGGGVVVRPQSARATMHQHPHQQHKHGGSAPATHTAQLWAGEGNPLAVVGLGSGGPGSRPSLTGLGHAQTRFKPSRVLSGGSQCGAAHGGGGGFGAFAHMCGGCACGGSGGNLAVQAPPSSPQPGYPTSPGSDGSTPRPPPPPPNSTPLGSASPRRPGSASPQLRSHHQNGQNGQNGVPPPRRAANGMPPHGFQSASNGFQWLPTASNGMPHGFQSDEKAQRPMEEYLQISSACSIGAAGALERADGTLSARVSQELALGFAKQQEHVELRPANLEQFAAEGEGLGEGGGGRIVSSADMGLGGGGPPPAPRGTPLLVAAAGDGGDA